MLRIFICSEHSVYFPRTTNIVILNHEYGKCRLQLLLVQNFNCDATVNYCLHVSFKWNCYILVVSIGISIKFIWVLVIPAVNVKWVLVITC